MSTAPATFFKADRTGQFLESEKTKEMMSAVLPDFNPCTDVIIAGDLSMFDLLKESYSIDLPKDFVVAMKTVTSPQQFINRLIVNHKVFLDPYNNTDGNSQYTYIGAYPICMPAKAYSNNNRTHTFTVPNEKIRKIHRLFNTKNITIVDYIKNLTSVSADYTGYAHIIFKDVPFTMALFSSSVKDTFEGRLAYVVSRENLDKFNSIFAEYIYSRILIVEKFLEDLVDQIVNLDQKEILHYRLEITEEPAMHMGRSFAASASPYAMTNSAYASGNVTWTPLPEAIIKREISTVYMPKNIKKEIISALNDFFDPEGLAFSLKHSIIHKLTMLFYGVPGTGKTSIIKAIATNYNLDIATIKMSRADMTDDTLTDALIAVPPDTIIVIEEIDACFDENRHSKMHNTVTLGTLLDMLDGINSHNNQIIILTTNYKERLDEALIRNGRVTYSFPFDYMQKDEIIDMTKDFYSSETIEEINEFANRMVEMGTNFTPAYLQQIFVHYRKISLAELIKKIKTGDIIEFINPKSNDIYSKKIASSTNSYIY